MHVFEKAHEFKPVGAAIGLFPNGLAALEALSPSVYRRVREACIAHDISHNYDLNNELVRTVDFSQMKMVSPTYLVWYLLQKFLMEEFRTFAESTGGASRIYMGHSLESFVVDSRSGVVTLQLHNRATQLSFVTKSRVLIGADGIHSVVRPILFPDESSELIYHDKVMFRAVLPVSEMVLQHDDANDDGTSEGVDSKQQSTNLCPPIGVSVSYSGDEKGKLFAFRETSPGIATFTAMAAYPDQPPSFGKSDEERKKFVVDKFRNYPKPVLQVMERVSASSVLINPVFSISVLEEWSKGPVVLIGDAVHGMTPGLGQGANQGLEDAIELVHTLSTVLLSKKDATTDVLSTALTTFWRDNRLHRVREIHAASSARTREINSSVKVTSPVAKEEMQALFKRIYSWKPSFIEGE